MMSTLTKLLSGLFLGAFGRMVRFAAQHLVFLSIQKLLKSFVRGWLHGPKISRCLILSKRVAGLGQLLAKDSMRRLRSSYRLLKAKVLLF
uniref:AMADH1 n=1 Tax=Arundo donax TaxID=35708 RepID=A0A0A9FJQ5_ARUDO